MDDIGYFLGRNIAFDIQNIQYTVIQMSHRHAFILRNSLERKGG